MYINFRKLLALLLLFTLLPMQLVSAKEKFVLVIDPGHGGGDVGTPHRKGKQDEKTIALNVSLLLGQLVERRYPDVKVIYTRKTDTYPSLPDRTQIAKKAKGDLFISVHVNACPDESVRGFETYVFGVDGNGESEKKRLQDRMVEERENLDINGKMVNFDTDIDIETKILCQAQREKHNKQSMDFARLVQRSLIGCIKQTSYEKQCYNRGIKQKNLFVLCFSPMPAILVELGYMSNKGEEKFINTQEAQGCFATALFNAFGQYKTSWDKRQLSNLGAETKAQPKQEVKKEDPKAKPESKKEEPKAQPKKEETKPQPKQEDPQAKPTQKKEESKAQSKKEEPKAQTKKEEPKPQPKAEPAPQQSTGKTVWKIQFMMSPKLLKEGDKEMKGLKGFSYYKEGNTYKYTYGSAPTTQALSEDMKKVKTLFPQAFPVKFDTNGKRIR